MGQPSSSDSSQSGDDQRARRLDLSLFSLGGPFAGYAGPALVTGPNGVVLAANTAADELAQMVKTTPPRELRTAIETALAGRSAQVNPLFLPTADGEQQPRAFDLTVLPWGDGAAALILGRDITVDRRVRQALVLSHQRYKDFIDLLSEDFAWETDRDGRFVYVSPRGGLGYPAEEMLSQRATDYVIDGAVAQAFQTTEPLYQAELRLRRADGTVMRARVSATPVIDEDGTWCGARGLCRDVSG